MEGAVHIEAGVAGFVATTGTGTTTSTRMVAKTTVDEEEDLGMTEVWVEDPLLLAMGVVQLVIWHRTAATRLPATRGAELPLLQHTKLLSALTNQYRNMLRKKQ